MGDSSTLNVPETDKKFHTKLTDYSARHESTTGPYADNLDIDALIVGAGFSKLSHHDALAKIGAVN